MPATLERLVVRKLRYISLWVSCRTLPKLGIVDVLNVVVGQTERLQLSGVGQQVALEVTGQ